MGAKLVLVNARTEPLKRVDSKREGPLEPGEACHYWLDPDSYGLVISADEEQENVLVLWSIRPKFMVGEPSTNPCGEIMLMGDTGLVSKETVMRWYGLNPEDRPCQD